MARTNPILENIPPYPITELDRLKAQVRAEGRTLYDFSVGDPVDPTPSFIKQAFLDSVTDVSQYPPCSQGVRPTPFPCRATSSSVRGPFPRTSFATRASSSSTPPTIPPGR